MKNIESRLVSELMKNGRRSDRELARVMGVSQPTVTRARTRLEKEGCIREYTLIPDFKKLGYHIMAMIFLKLSHPLSREEREEMFKGTLQLREGNLNSVFLVMDGIGMGEDIVIISFFRNFSEYSRYVQATRTEMTGRLKSLIYPEGLTSFLINLDGNDHYQPMTFSRMAADLQKATSQNELSDTP
jgi:Lrp/AsnC family transcriptional regulator for asnA, asnC and gidA